MRTSVAGNQSYEGDLDEFIKEAGKHANLCQLKDGNIFLTTTYTTNMLFPSSCFDSVSKQILVQNA